MRKRKLKAGDAVFYPSAGVGFIENIEDLYIGGKCEPCYVIRVEENKMTVKVPQSNLEKSGIRPLMDGKKLKELFKILESESSRRVTGGNWTERCKDIERKINHGNHVELGGVVRDLLRWKDDSGLSFEEAMLLETACGYLSRELAEIQGISAETAIDNIRNRVGVSAAA